MTDERPTHKPATARSKPNKSGAVPLKGEPMRGAITRILHGQKYGFLRASNDRVVYFHRSDIAEGTSFNDLAVGDAVSFELFEDRVTGPRALRLRKTS